MHVSKRILSGGLAMLMGLAACLTPAYAAPFDPTGLWEATDGESRYEVALCGDGTQLCAKLIWIRPDVVNDRNKQYLNTFVVEGADRYNDREWRGTINLYGVSVRGSVQRLAPDRMQVRGCALIILCERKTVTRIGSL